MLEIFFVWIHLQQSLEKTGIDRFEARIGSIAETLVSCGKELRRFIVNSASREAKEGGASIGNDYACVAWTCFSRDCRWKQVSGKQISWKLVSGRQISPSYKVVLEFDKKKK